MTTDTTIAVAMFTVSDQDAAVSFYTEKLGWEIRTDVSWGDGAEAGRWVEVAPAASVARLSLNLPMGGQPGGGSIGVETADLGEEKARLQGLGIEVANEMPAGGPVPAMFSFTDPDGNWVWVVATA